MGSDDPQQALKILGERIREARLSAGYSQTQLAALLDVSKQTVSSWERGIAPPMVTSLLKLSAVLRVDIGELFADLSEDISLQNYAEKRVSAAGRLLPLFGDEEACGAVLMELQVLEPSRYIAATIPVGPKDVAYTVTSKANAPKLHVGDQVILRVGAEPEPGQFVFACVKGKFLLRRYLPKHSGTHVGACLKAEHPAFPDEEMAEGDVVLAVMATYTSSTHD